MPRIAGIELTQARKTGEIVERSTKNLADSIFKKLNNQPKPDEKERDQELYAVGTDTAREFMELVLKTYPIMRALRDLAPQTLVWFGSFFVAGMLCQRALSDPENRFTVRILYEEGEGSEPSSENNTGKDTQNYSADSSGYSSNSDPETQERV